VADPFVEQVLDVATLTPSLDIPLSADEELALVEQLVNPTITAAVDTDIVAIATDPVPFGRSWRFDFEARRFDVGGSGHVPLVTTGIDTLAGWIEKCLMTPRGSCPIHSDEYGLEGLEELIGSDPSDSVALEAAVRDALTFHPRIIEVQDFEASWDEGDEVVEVSFTVILDDATLVPIANVTLGG
jgi:hypothetical protein